MTAMWHTLAASSAVMCGAGALVGAAIAASRVGDTRPVLGAAALALGITALWAFSVAIVGPVDGKSGALLKFTDLQFLWVVYRLFGQDARDRQLAPIRPLLLSLGFVGMLQIVVIAVRSGNAGTAGVAEAITPFAALLALLFCIGALVLVHNLYSGATGSTRHALKWPAAALALMWLYDLNSATTAYLTGERSLVLAECRPGVMLAAVALFGIGLFRSAGSPKFQPSRQVTFQSISLIAIGAYFVVMAVVIQAAAYTGDLARTVQVGFLLALAGLGLAVLPSARRRSWVRVMLSKHLFQHRYDYRAEWLRFNATIGRAGPSASPLRERVVQAVADIADSPRGLLLTPREQGGLELSARWQWPAIEVPAEAAGAAAAAFFEQSEFILDLDELRAERGEGIPAGACPAWLLAEKDAWALVPLLHYERLVGLVVLARPPLRRRLDWEDFDLMRVVGRQLASYLAEQTTQDALSEAQRFDEFNRRIAFVMHDIKNLASQLSLLSRNAERHADKAEFRADMLITLRNSSSKLETLLARLGRYGGQADNLEPLAVGPLLAEIAERYRGQRDVVALERPDCSVIADRESLEQALVHLVQNAIDASPETAPVFLDVRQDGNSAVIEVIDSGSGMSAEFVRTQLFKPFQSSKPGGFGIGAFEAREMVRAMGGWLDVESREGLGTRFLLRLPLAGAANLVRTPQSYNSEVA